jgi:hypothetical protein
MYSASVVDAATVGCKRLDHEITPPLREREREDYKERD